MKLRSFLRPYIKESVLAPLLKLTEATLELFVPLVITAIIDRGIGRGDDGFILSMGGVLFLLAFVGMAVSITAQYFAARAATCFSTDMRRSLMRHILHMDVNALNRVGSSTIMTRMTSDINQVNTALNLFLRLFLRSPFIVFGAMVMAFTIDIGSALVFAVIIPLLGLTVFILLKITIPAYKNVQSRLDTLLGATRANLAGVRVIRGFGKQGYEKASFDQKNEGLAGVQTGVGRVQSLLNPITMLIVNVGIIILIRIGGVKVEVGELTQGQVVALINYMSQILIELIKLANLIININRALACADRVREVFDLPETSDERLDVYSPDIKPGEVIGIIGGTGSGKSTILYEMLKKYDDVGYVPQKTILHSGTVRDNLIWGNEDASDDELYDALKAACAYDFVMEKGGLDARVEAKGRNFSGGQRQRLCIARALVGRPGLMLFDDSFSALDNMTGKNVKNALYDQVKKQGCSMVIVSQRTWPVADADRIIVLDDCKIVGEGTHDELLTHCEVYAEVYRIGGGR